MTLTPEDTEFITLALAKAVSQGIEANNKLWQSRFDATESRVNELVEKVVELAARRPRWTN